MTERKKGKQIAHLAWLEGGTGHDALSWWAQSEKGKELREKEEA